MQRVPNIGFYKMSLEEIDNDRWRIQQNNSRTEKLVDSS